MHRGPGILASNEGFPDEDSIGSGFGISDQIVWFANPRLGDLHARLRDQVCDSGEDRAVNF
jgi:hypothetical protein